jgi:peroxiredoxin Q/BCP
MTPKAGDTAPDFSALDDADRRISLSDFKGKVVVLYFISQRRHPG